MAILNIFSPIRYLAWCAIGLLGTLAIDAVFAALIDPYYVFGSPAIAGINERHPRADDQMVAARSHLAARMQPRTLLLGNSRTEAGFDPDSRDWPQSMRPVFNGGLPGMGLGDARPVVESAFAGGRLKHLVIAVEFLDTINDNLQQLVGAHIRLPVPPLTLRLEKAHQWFIATLTTGALVDSVATVLEQRSASQNIMRRNGSTDLDEYAEFVRQAGGAALFEHKIAEYRERFASYKPPDYSSLERHTTFTALIALLDAAHARDCAADIIIYPYHAAMLDLIASNGLWPGFERFKRALVNVVWVRYPGTRIVDFSGYNTFTMEPPPPSGAGAAMRWYWEPGHFRTALGDQIIDRLYAKANGFGRDLRPDNIDSELAAMRNERDRAVAERK